MSSDDNTEEAFDYGDEYVLRRILAATLPSSSFSVGSYFEPVPRQDGAAALQPVIEDIAADEAEKQHEVRNAAPRFDDSFFLLLLFVPSFPY